MTRPHFVGSFTQQPPIPDAGIYAAIKVMQSGRLHRYNIISGQESEVMELERAYAVWQGARYCLAVASGGQAMQIALRAAGVRPGNKVLTNAFTLAPVPGAIAALGARPVYVEITEDLVIDFDDLATKAEQSQASVLLLSHMRGHQCDMDELVRFASKANLTVLEDCAHSMGATWNGRRSGSFGLAGCFSTQTYKHMNSGEGGLLTSDDADFIAKATILSGSYMLYARHGAGPDPELFSDVRLDTPNMSARMDNLRAAILLPQLTSIEESIEAWNKRYDLVADRLTECIPIRLPRRPAAECYVGSSIQFRVPHLSVEGAKALVTRLSSVGVEVKWFGAAMPEGFTSTHHSWRYAEAQRLPRTDDILSTLFDMRLPLTFSPDDCLLIADHIVDAITELVTRGHA